MSEARKTMRELSTEINTDLSKFVQEYIVTLKSTTPIRTGRARRGWQNVLKRKAIGKGGTFPIAKNDVPYIGVLDNGSSRQAPTGIVEPALRKTRKR